MRIAILGATSQIARDLVLGFAAHSAHDLSLFARRPEAVDQWLAKYALTGRYSAHNFSAFGTRENFDAVLNFVGVGNPAQAITMGASIFDVTLRYDQMALDYLDRHPECRYLFLSSGAAYGSTFKSPAEMSTQASVAINALHPQDWYGVAKLYAECRHRALKSLSIIDLRVFSYFSHTQDIEARFLITDMLRAIREKIVLQTSADYIVRDFLHPTDFRQLVEALLTTTPINCVLDCYSQAPIDKPTLLEIMQQHFGLRYEVMPTGGGVNATGHKSHYYSLNKRAADFGYHPLWTSLGGLVSESEKMLGRHMTPPV